MKAWLLNQPASVDKHPLVISDVREPVPGPGELLLRVAACGVCRTDLHLLDGELPGIRYPLTPGHEVVGRVVSAGGSAHFAQGDRVGVPWLGGTCGSCRWCREGRENLCGRGQFTGYTRDGGYAEYVVARAD